jgi:U3 small nucleolar RNA-associated protein 25
MAGRRGGQGGKGKGGGSQGIRKRKGGRPSAKNNPKRQRLAKVVAREGAREDGHEARYAARQALEQVRKQSTRQVGGGGLDEEDAAVGWGAEVDGTDSDSNAGSVPDEEMTQAYDALVDELEAVSPGSRATGFMREPKRVEKRPRTAREDVAPPPQDVGDGEPVELRDLSGEAAARENAHFMAQLSAEQFQALSNEYYEYGPSCVLPGIGKVSLAGAPEMESDADQVLSEQLIGNARISSLGLQPSVISRWKALHGSASAAPFVAVLNPVEKLSRSEAALALSLRSFRDVLFCRSLSPNDEQRARQVVVAHALSHALRARARVLRNDTKLRERETRCDAPDADAGGDAADLEEDEDDEQFRDQGFARPRILFVLPMRNDAYDIVSLITKLAVGAGEGETTVAQVANRDRFEEEFAPEAEEGEEEEEQATVTEAGRRRKARGKPADWNHRFRGNVDDDFKLGISLTKKTVKLYSDFYNSDIIIASPLGLVRSMEVKKSGAGRKGVRKRNARDKNRAVDDWNAGAAKLNQVAHKKTSFAEDDEADDDGFLSSIEICVVDGASTFAMQNWSLLLTTLERVNNMPARPRDTDFSRVRQWALDGKMRFYRQTVVLSLHKRADALALFRTFLNHSGRVRVLTSPKSDGTMSDVAVALRQRFLRVAGVTTPETAPDRHFEYFMNKVLPELRSSVDCQAVVVIPNYFDFVRVRNALVTLEADVVSFHFASVSEYSKESDVARAKTRFFTKKVSIFVMTERIHYYWRSNVRGANTIVWYGLPENSHFYPEIVNTTAEAAELGRPVHSIAMYDEFESFALERIVGTSRSKKMTGKFARSEYLFAMFK